MALISPGIESKEVNKSSTIGSSATGRAAMVGKFSWGPAFQVTQVTGEPDLVDQFGESNDYTFASFMTANNFLKYANDLRLVRIVDAETAQNSSPLYNVIDFGLGPEANSGYDVGDEFDVMYGSDVVNPNTTGKVTEVSTNGVVAGVYVSSSEIIADIESRGLTDLSGYTVEFTNTAGSGANIELFLGQSANVYFPNSDFASDSLSANEDDDSFLHMSTRLGLPSLAARYPGSKGDDIKVYIVNKEDYDASITPTMGNVADGNVTVENYPYGDTDEINVKSYFQYGPTSSAQYAVVVKLGEVVVESYIVSTNEMDKDYNGVSIFIDDFFENDGSRYISATTGNWPTHSGSYSLGGGKDDTADAGDWNLGWDLLADPETLYANLMIASNVADESEEIASNVSKYAQGVVDQRQDCLLFVSPPKSLVINKVTSIAVANIVAWRTGRDSQGNVLDANFNVDTSYVAVDGNYKYQYDKYSNRNRWVPLGGDIAGLCAYTDQVSQPWMSPAGLNRGQIRNVIKLAVDTRQAHRDALYEVGINPVVSLSGSGTVLYGDKTATQLASAFDRINVRRLFNMVKKAVSDSAKYKLFELNDEFTRFSFKSEIDSYLDNIRALGGVYDFRVVCDETNNTSQVIDTNQFVADIYLKPARSINFITLSFVATSTGADFDEIIG